MAWKYNKFLIKIFADIFFSVGHFVNGLHVILLQVIILKEFSLFIINLFSSFKAT